MKRAMIASVMRSGELVGRLDCELARLHSLDQRLLALWADWQRDGFRVLGPAPEPLPPDVACAVYVGGPAESRRHVAGGHGTGEPRLCGAIPGLIRRSSLPTKACLRSCTSIAAPAFAC